MPPPGWHRDPHGQPGQRYWDGGAWTDNFEPDPPTGATLSPRDDDAATDRLRNIGIGFLLLELLIPYVGIVPLVIGGVLLSRNRIDSGVILLVLSVLIFAARFALYARTGYESAF